MKKTLLVVAAGLVLVNGAAQAAGCLKGAAVGGVAGHVAGHHGVLGAAGGCLVGRHMAKKQEKEAAQQKQGALQTQKNLPAPAPAPAK